MRGFNSTVMCEMKNVHCNSSMLLPAKFGIAVNVKSGSLSNGLSLFALHVHPSVSQPLLLLGISFYQRSYDFADYVLYRMLLPLPDVAKLVDVRAEQERRHRTFAQQDAPAHGLSNHIAAHLHQFHLHRVNVYLVQP